nr:MAG TPA: protein of unknown function (DUF1803) [Caudoviricetes sp.]
MNLCQPFFTKMLNYFLSYDIMSLRRYRNASII